MVWVDPLLYMPAAETTCKAVADWLALRRAAFLHAAASGLGQAARQH
jgi:hypothetical protein